MRTTRIVGCFLEYRGKFVILLRHSHKPDGNTWGLASGKVEVGETDEVAMLRELHEETGYRADRSELLCLGEYPFTATNGNPYVFVAFNVQLTHSIAVQLEHTAHVEYKWVTARECYARTDLIADFHELLRLIGYIQTDKK